MAYGVPTIAPRITVVQDYTVCYDLWSMSAYLILSYPNRDVCYVLCLLLFRHSTIMKYIKDSIYPFAPVYPPFLPYMHKRYVYNSHLIHEIQVLLSGDDIT